MGQKVNPNGFRIGFTHTWPSTWFARGKKYGEFLLQDVLVKRFIREKYKEAGISLIEIERTKKVVVTIHTSKPGVLIGKQGAAIEELRKELERNFHTTFAVEIQEILMQQLVTIRTRRVHTNKHLLAHQTFIAPIQTSMVSTFVRNKHKRQRHYLT
jgi:small subunit ribosomal protein S3